MVSLSTRGVLYSLSSSGYWGTFVWPSSYRNPVKAGINKKVEEYPFSTVANIFNAQAFPPIFVPKLLMGKFSSIGVEKVLEWLNEPLKKGTRRAYKKGKSTEGICVSETPPSWVLKELLRSRNNINKPHFSSRSLDR